MLLFVKTDQIKTMRRTGPMTEIQPGSQRRYSPDHWSESYTNSTRLLLPAPRSQAKFPPNRSSFRGYIM